MHLNAIGKALKSKTKSANQFTPALNNITGKRPGAPSVKKFIGKGGQNQKWNPPKNYKPSNGIGVGY